MAVFLQNHFTWILALHIMAFISWMAGLFYLPRLFVYHTQVKSGTEEDQRFSLMEKRLYKQIMTPAMIVTFLTGGVMAVLPHSVDWQSIWWWVKLASVLGMAGFQGCCGLWGRNFASGKNTHNERFYRCVNEIPTVLMMIIVIMIVVRP
ncbi:protoporphyrinogen oxidase HemJ [Acetobacteraceae bacterium ESL0709]|nr:protoporphyrinogen oxidase HemJ [Acetobacteraceae bacterium ESL0697]MDF7677111.1 protoporphyrinogen oxidase HemJ [Acetobacteraceae bacterium ESL0709]